MSRTEGLLPGDIDARILRVEQRLMAREERLRRGANRFGRQLDEAMQPRRFIKPALIAAGAAALLLWRRPARIAAGTAPVVAAAAAKPAVFALLAGLPWSRLVHMAWPMLPERWRRQVSPATATSLLAVGLPLLGSLFTPRPKAQHAQHADGDARPG
ncbi:hypothetical protein [Roseateles sp.]|uniref:hypothetical protein n=1 Tax=Roseateles sp. TaxID=1971397 RepID=UPI0032642A01